MSTLASPSLNNNGLSPSSPLEKPPVLKMPLIPVTSSATNLVKPIVQQPLFPTAPPPTSSSPNSPAHSPPTTLPQPNLEQLRLQQLYTLALADRMRMMHHNPGLLGPYAPNPAAPLQPRPFPPGGGGPPPPGAPGAITPDFNHPLYPYGKFDPRLFRLPEEPKPQHSYIGLISMAILSHPDKKLVLADIYQYILDNFAYFRHRGPGWRNSIRHNLSLNDCFIKAGRAANGKGHYWAIHPACIDDFTRGDYRRRKAQRKVRKHMGLAVDEEDSPSPPPPVSMTSPMLPWPPLMGPLALHHPHHPPPHPLILQPHLQHRPLLPHQQLAASLPVSAPQPPPPLRETTATEATVPSRKRQFDVASLLGQAFSSAEKREKKEEDESERKVFFPLFPSARSLFSPIAARENDEEEEKKEQEETSDANPAQDVDVVSVGEEKNEEDEETKETEAKDSDGEEQGAPSSSPKPSPAFPFPIPSQNETAGNPAHEYLARYYQQLMQHHNAAMAAAATAGGESGTAAAAAEKAE